MIRISKLLIFQKYNEIEKLQSIYILVKNDLIHKLFNKGCTSNLS